MNINYKTHSVNTKPSFNLYYSNKNFPHFHTKAKKEKLKTELQRNILFILNSLRGSSNAAIFKDCMDYLKT